MRLAFAVLALLLAGSASAAIPSSERDALIAIYDATQGASWNDRTNWLGAQGTECTWFGVGCSADGMHVETLRLPQNNLAGGLTTQVSNLAALRVLDVSGNELTGGIPASVYQLTALEELNLGDNALTGPLDTQIANLTKLQNLYLYYNQLDGPIPAALASISTLEALLVQSNDFSGAIPVQLAQLPKLTALDLSDNALTGTIPPQLGDLTGLTSLGLSGNTLTGGIPSELGRLTKLRALMLGRNQLTGQIPDSLRSLTLLEDFYADENRLTGALPAWIGEWPLLDDLFVGGNRLSGPLPSGLSSLTNLTYLDIAQNDFTGPVVDLSRLAKLVYLRADGNRLSGPLPPSVGALTQVGYFAFGNNELTGALPRELGNLVNVEYFDLSNNAFEGPIPAEIGNLRKAYNISLHVNRLSGPLPKELGQLTALQYLSVSFNALRGAIPTEIVNMSGLLDDASSFGYNALYTNDSAVRNFVNRKSQGGDFEETQTVSPSNIQLTTTTDRSATLTWLPIRYSYYGGGYQVAVSTTPGGTPVLVQTTNSKTADSIVVRDLQPSTTYYFTVTTVSHPIQGQVIAVVSDPSAPVQGSTKERTLAPPDVVMTAFPNGMVQVDGAQVKGDSLTLTNFGDVATDVQMETNDTFFTISPMQFSLGAGASQIVTLTSKPQTPGTYYAWVSAEGVGVSDDIGVTVILLATARPTGTVIAEPLKTRIDLAGAPGSDEVGQAQFRNVGTARLSGIVLSDQPWVIPSTEPVSIDPGQVGSVNFTISRAKRPASEGAASANLSLVYVDGAISSGLVQALTTTTPGVSVSIVTIVDQTKPSVSVGPLPPIPAGIIPFFIPGISSAPQKRSDLSIVNAFGNGAIDDLKVYFTSASQTSAASLLPLGFGKSVQLVNLVDAVYGLANATGSLQVRSKDIGGLETEAKVTAIKPEGSYSGSVPVFRGDRSIGPGLQLLLTGLSRPGDLFVQETVGEFATVRIEFYDASGNAAGTPIENNVPAFGLLERPNAIPSSAVTAVVRNLTGGSITAYARLTDSNGDTWSVVDWSTYYDYSKARPVRIPFADGSSPSSETGRRRAVRNVRSEALPRATTTIHLFNPTDSPVRATVRVVSASGSGSSREVSVGPRATLTMNNVAGTAGSPVGHVLVSPLEGELAVTARSSSSSGGTAVPVLNATEGLRLGQSHLFADLEDSAAAQTSFGLVETSGRGVTVQAEIVFSDPTALASAVTSRTYTLAPFQHVFVAELVRAFAGAARESLGDLRGLTLEVRVTSGEGAMVPFVIATDTGTGDTNLRLP